MTNIYLPIDNVSDFACYSVYDKDTIRAYYTQPHIDSSSEYVDFFVNSHYLQKTGDTLGVEDGGDLTDHSRLDLVVCIGDLVGPSSILLAVMGSGFNGQSFAFHGYLPIDGKERAKRLKQLEARAKAEKQTQLFIETPYRNAKLFADICNACAPTTRLCVAAGLTTENEYIRTHTLKEWKQKGLPDLGKIPAIFLIY